MRILIHNNFGSKVLYLLIFFSQYQLSYSQKSLLTFETYKTWSEVTTGDISNNGKYTYYTVENQPVGSTTTVIESSDKKWRRKILNCKDINFSSSNKYVIYKTSSDKVYTLTLGSSKISAQNNSNSYRLFKSFNREKIAYYDDVTKELNIGDLGDNRCWLTKQVDQFVIGNTGNCILIKQKDKNQKKERLLVFDIKNNRLQTIYCGDNISQMVFDKYDKQVAFIIQNDIRACLLTFNLINKKLDTLFNDGQNKMKIDLTNFHFSDDTNHIFLTLSQANVEQISNQNRQVWSYKDSYIQSFYYLQPNLYERKYLSIIDLKSKKLTQLLDKNQKIIGSTFKPETDSIFVAESHFGSTDEIYIPSSRSTYSICFTYTGKQKDIDIDKVMPIKNISVSPQGNFIIYFDPISKSYHSYNVLTGKKIDLTGKIGNVFCRYDKITYPHPEIFSTAKIFWLSDRGGAIVQGDFDLWLLDPTGEKEPVNITKGFGKTHKIVFTISSIPDVVPKLNDKILISGLDDKTKDFGFYKVKISREPELTKLWSDRCYVSNLENKYFELGPRDLIKAKSVNKYLVKMESSNKAPNFFITDNFKSFQSLSDVQPQEKYNWLTTELLNYENNEGTKYQGILYKPENFDDSKKYPILFIYYKEFSSLLNKFGSVELATANFNIAYAVSNGYIVYQPDIISEIGKPGEGALQSVLAARQYLSKFSWADLDNIGIAGHSFGGFETNYIIAHTDKFKAAVSCSGMTSLAGDSYSQWGDVFAIKAFYYKNSDYQMGKMLADDPNSYIENSPIVYVKNIKTPVLLMHNSEDKNVPVQQGRQFFLALRSLQKPIWWLNYVKDGHGVGGNNQLDYNIKVFEFLDFYLRSKEEPKWMKEHL